MDSFNNPKLRKKHFAKWSHNSQGRGSSSSRNWLACFQLRADDPNALTKQNPIMPSRLNLQPSTEDEGLSGDQMLDS
jgi:hypothetical protein